MFGYVLPSRDRLDERERERFRAVYCGLCHTLRERYGFAASLLLNYDFTLLAILLSSGDEESCAVRRCAVHPCKGCRAQTSTPALEAAADRTVILSWWQLRDHIADHGFWSGLKYRFASLFLRGAYRRAGERLPHFDAAVRLHLQALAALEDARCASIDMAAEPFAALMADAAADLTDEKRRRILGQILYQLGRWIYLIDAADDLKKDTESGNYNPLLYRYHTENGVLGDADRLALAETLDASIERMRAPTHFTTTAYGRRSWTVYFMRVFTASESPFWTGPTAAARGRGTVNARRKATRKHYERPLQSIERLALRIGRGGKEGLS